MNLGKYTIKIVIMSLILGVILHSPDARAQNVIRDAEIEHDLRVISEPIFDAAGLTPSQVRIIVINDDAVNAFVAGGQNLFLYTGLLLDAENVGELAGVIAHESGHMAGGHLIRMRGAMERASIESVIATVLGVAIGVGAGDGQAGIATAMGGSEYATRSFLRHSRVLESSADQSGMASLTRAGYSSKYMADFLERLSSQEVLPELQRSPYVLTHPLSRERLQAVQSYVANHPGGKEFPKEWEENFKRLQAKILGFTEPQQALRKFAGDNSLVGKYARTIALYRTGKISEALDVLNGLQGAEPKNGYFYELRGQILFEQSRIDESIVAYRQAAILQPRAGLINLSLAQALLQNEKRDPSEAIAHLIIAKENGEQDTSQVYRWLAIAYGRQGKEGQAKLALAEEALLKGDSNFAMDQAKRAETMLKSDPVSVQRARDIQSAALRVKKDKKN